MHTIQNIIITWMLYPDILLPNKCGTGYRCDWIYYSTFMSLLVYKSEKSFQTLHA